MHTGLSKENFKLLFNSCGPLIEETRIRNIVKRDLILFLTKMRQEISDDILKVIFEYSSRQAVSMAIGKVLKILMHDFVPKYLGLEAITRDQYIEKHVTEFSNQLYNADNTEKVAIATVDGTYLYIPKSSNWRVLRQSFSMHKGRHLIKPVMLTAPDGYILDVHGPYFSDSKNNDAAILIDHFNKDVHSLKTWLQPNDILLVDRGYRDSLPFLNSIGIKTKMPSYLPRGEKQHSDEEANTSRLVTKTRWIVEARNGHTYRVNV
jgi:hypothetical protein